MRRIYIILGKSATGKDTIYRKLLKRNQNLKPIIGYTTRPIRINETDGNEYHFITEKKFQEMKEDKKIIEYRSYSTVVGNWIYFTAMDNQFQDTNGLYCLISTLEGYVSIKNFFNNDKIIPLYIEVPDIPRLQRSLQREGLQKNPCVAEICRRFLSDEKDFSIENLRRAGITDSIINVQIDEAISEIEQKMQLF